MARKKIRTLLVGIAYSGEALLLLPSPGAFDLPSFEKKGCLKRCLVRELTARAFEGVSLIRKFDRVEKEVAGEKVYLIGCVFSYANMNQTFRLLPVSSKPEDAPELAKVFLWKCDVYAPVYLGMPRTVPFLPPEQKKVDKELDCLNFHVRLIGKKTLEEFRSLCASAASMRRVNEAFVAICNQYHVNPCRTADNPSGKLEARK